MAPEAQSNGASGTPVAAKVGQNRRRQHERCNIDVPATLAVVMVGWFYHDSQICSKQKPLAGIQVGTVALQSYHVVEHSVKLAQFLTTGMQGTPGIVGMQIDRVIFHSLMNTAVLVPVVVVFFCAGLHTPLIQRAS